MITYRAKPTHILKQNMEGARLTMTRHTSGKGAKETHARAKAIYDACRAELVRRGAIPAAPVVTESPKG